MPAISPEVKGAAFDYCAAWNLALISGVCELRFVRLKLGFTESYSLSGMMISFRFSVFLQVFVLANSMPVEIFQKCFWMVVPKSFQPDCGVVMLGLK
jgi:hypothetical protein